MLYAIRDLRIRSELQMRRVACVTSQNSGERLLPVKKTSSHTYEYPSLSFAERHIEPSR